MTNVPISTPAEADAALDLKVRRNQRRAFTWLAAILAGVPAGVAGLAFVTTGEAERLIPAAGAALSMVVGVALVVTSTARVVPRLGVALGIPVAGGDEREARIADRAMALAFAITLVVLVTYSILWRHRPSLLIAVAGQSMFLIFAVMENRRT